MSGHGPAIPVKHSPTSRNAHAGAQAQLEVLGRDQPGLEQSDRMSTYLPMDTAPNVPPNMRMHTRWAYLEEYLGYWKFDHVCKVVGAFLLAAGITTLNVFAPGALLMIAVSARIIDLGWWYNFIWSKFGNNRSLVFVD
jgi:hypothetical protein